MEEMLAHYEPPEMYLMTHHWKGDQQVMHYC
jgi:hypothetical protein